MCSMFSSQNDIGIPVMIQSKCYYGLNVIHSLFPENFRKSRNVYFFQFGPGLKALGVSALIP